MSDPHKTYVLSFLEEPLHPLSAARKAAADAIGAKFFRLGNDEWDELLTRQTYPGIVMDVAIILWVMTLPAAKAVRACVNSVTAAGQAMAWADENKIGAGDKHYNEAQEVLSEILIDLVRASQAGAKEDDGEDLDEEASDDDGLGEA